MNIFTDIRQTPEYADYLRSLGWIVEKKDGVNYFIRRFPLIGPVIKIQRPKEIDYRYIDVSLIKEYRPFQIIIEPSLTTNYQLLTTYGYKPSKTPYLPTKTLQLDLTKSEKELMRRIKKDARSAIKKNHDLRYKIYELGNLERFRTIWKKSIPLKRYVPSIKNISALKKSFADNSLFITDKSECGGAIFLKSKDVAYYWQAFTNRQGRKAQVQYKIVWEGIKWAKKSGCKIFDFEGIYDERFPNKSWRGFTHFKKSFGGYEIVYPAAFVSNRFRNLLQS